MIPELRIEDYNYPLPDERIAKYPLSERDSSKLLRYENVDVLVSQFPYDTDDTCTLDTDAGSDRIDSVIIGLHSDLGPFARYADYLLYGDESVIDFRNFLLEKLLEEFV